MSSSELLHDLAALGGVSNLELAACDLGALRPREVWLLANLLISSLVSNISGAIDAVGVVGEDALKIWVAEAALGGWGVITNKSSGSPLGSLPSMCHSELRKVIQTTLDPFLDAACSLRLARLGYVRFPRRSIADFEKELDKDVPFSGEFQEKAAGWFLSGLTQQTETLLQGLGKLVELPVALGLVDEPIELTEAMKEVSQTVFIAHGCLRAAATLVKYELPVCDCKHPIPSLLSLRVLDWAFRRVEYERHEVVLRFDWRLHSSRLFWDFYIQMGTRHGGPRKVVDAFSIYVVLPACSKQRTGSASPQGYGVDIGAAASEVEAPKSKPEESTVVEDELATKKSQRRKRAHRKTGRESSKEHNDCNEDVLEIANSNLDKSAGNTAELSQAMREWSRLSVQMMLEMGWRAEDGTVN